MRRAKRCLGTSARFPCCLGTWKRNIETATTERSSCGYEGTGKPKRGKRMRLKHEPKADQRDVVRREIRPSPNFIPLYIGYVQVGVRWLLIICRTIILWLVKKLTFHNESCINLYDSEGSYIINPHIIGWISGAIIFCTLSKVQTASFDSNDVESAVYSRGLKL